MEKYYIVKELKNNKYIKSSFDCNWDELEYTDDAGDALFYYYNEELKFNLSRFILKIPDTHRLMLEIITVYTN